MSLVSNPQNNLKFIHVAGTNGKGSTCALISSVLSEAGYKTGLYISPSVMDFRERIQINSSSISKEKVCELVSFFENYANMEEFKNDNITEFEFTTAMAFKYFCDEKCDVVILETGLGGRLDATNIIEKSICSVITSISKDHTKILGKTLSEISKEKSGIIKNSCPVVLGPEIPDEAKTEIFTKAENCLSPVFTANLGQLKDIVCLPCEGMYFKYRDLELKTRLLGFHQLKNISTALKVIDVIKEQFEISDDSLFKGILEAYMPCRLEIIKTKPLIILDGAHNPDGARCLKEFINTFFKGKNILGIIGIFKDKDYNTVIRETAPLFNKIHTVEPNNERALPLKEVTEIVSLYNINVKSFKNISSAVKEAIEHSSNYDTIIAYGSFSIMKEIKDTVSEHIF